MTTGVFVYREPAKVVQDILQSEMGLTPQQVLFTNQKYLIPTTGLLIVVSYVGPSKVVCSVDESSNDVNAVFTETQSIVMLHLLQIDILSFDDSARLRKEEIAMAIHSLFAQAQMEIYAMKLGRQPGPFMDTSFLEETKIVTRYTTTLTTNSVNRKIKPVGDYYTDFTRAVPPQLVTNA